MKTKTCSDCKKTYPATLEYFFKKVYKAGTIIRGVVLKKDCICLRHICRSCNTDRVKLLRYKRRAKELNISLEEYQKNVDKIRNSTISLKKLKYIEFKDLPPKERNKKVRIMRLGYTMEEVDNYQTLWREHIKKVTISRRKYQYDKNVYPLTNAQYCKAMRQEHAPCMIALNMHISVKDLTPELLELGIKSVNLKRQIKSTKTK